MLIGMENFIVVVHVIGSYQIYATPLLYTYYLLLFLLGEDIDVHRNIGIGTPSQKKHLKHPLCLRRL